ncbi:MAG: circadian clock KaiB family protein [Balneolaceae bacterium]
MDRAAEQKIKTSEGMNYSFTLFVIQEGENSERAIENLKRLCEKWLPGRYKINIVDVLEDFQTALDYNILLTPSVVITDPKPQITIHGDLSDSRKFVAALNLKEENEE